MAGAHRAPRVVTCTAPKGPTGVREEERRPCFTSTWVEKEGPCDQTVHAEYTVRGVPITVSSSPRESVGRYAVHPPEYDLSPALLSIVSEAMAEVTSSPPEDFDMTSMQALRPFIKERARDRIHRLMARRAAPSEARGLAESVEYISEVVSKYTAGYGVLETLLEDPTVQDVYVNAPSSQTPVFVVLRSGVLEGVGQKCRTNVLMGSDDLRALVSRVKLETGLPFSEAHPVLEADIPRLDARITLVGPPISAKGVSVAIRKHSRDILTLPMLIANGSLSPLLASFLWACVLGRRSVLIAGSRGAGKTTLLGALLLEFPLTQRILLIEDTPEIPVRRLRQLGYDIQSLKFGGGGPNEVLAEDTLRVSLRMGESAIAIGEVRGSEARVLYESMRAGSAGSAVLGTIHGNSAKGVLDRAVEDLGVTERAFCSTDIVVVIGLIRTPDGSSFSRKVVEVAEVRADGGRAELVELFAMEPGCSCAKPTDAFSPSSKTVMGIAESLGVSPEGLLEIVRARAHSDHLLASGQAEDGSSPAAARDHLRVSSNEVLLKSLFRGPGTDRALREWEGWYAARGP